jgi:hypothetical protein
MKNISASTNDARVTPAEVQQLSGHDQWSACLCSDPHLASCQATASQLTVDGSVLRVLCTEETQHAGKGCPHCKCPSMEVRHCSRKHVNVEWMISAASRKQQVA